MTMRQWQNGAGIRGIHDTMEEFKRMGGKLGSICEIGCFIGEATYEFCQAFEHVYAVDPWLPGYDPDDAAAQCDMAEVEKEFNRRTRSCKNLTKLKMMSHEAVLSFENHSLDLVYIDADHRYESVVKDLNLWIPKVKGIISGHDYHRENTPGVVKAIHDVIGKPDKWFYDSSWIKRISP